MIARVSREGREMLIAWYERRGYERTGETEPFPHCGAESNPGRGSMSIILYELRGKDDRRYSQFSWRTRLALAHKGLQPEIRPVRVSDKAAIAFSGQDKVPVLVDGKKVVVDSWRIAEHLEEAYPAQHSLLGGETGIGLTRFINAWVDRQIVPAIVPLLMIDVVRCVDADDALHLRSQIEKAFGNTLENLAGRRDVEISSFRRLLIPARATLRSQPFLSGAEPAYADYILFSVFQWARIVSDFEPLEQEDVVAAWRERMLDLFGGLARAARTSRAGPA
jgi:glutathione S-transferase